MPPVLSPHFTAYEPQLLRPEHPEPELLNRRSHHNEKPVHGNEEELPLIPSRETPSNKDPAAAKKKKLKVITNKRQVQTATSQEEKLPPS